MTVPGTPRTASRRRCTVAMLAAPAAFTLILTGCSSSSPADHPGTSSRSTGASGLAYAKQQVARYQQPVTTYPSPGPALNPSRVAALRGKTVLYVPLGLGAPLFQVQGAALKEALGHEGITVETCDPHFLPSAAATCLTNARAVGASAVVTSAISYGLAANAYRSLAAQHIPVLIGSGGPDSPPNSSLLAIQVGLLHPSKATDLGVDEVIAQSGGKAHVLFISVTDNSVIKREAALMQEEFANHCPACDVTTVDVNTADIGNLNSLVSSQLVSHPDIDYVLSMTDLYVPKALTGIQAAGRSQKVKIVTSTASISVLQMIQQGRFVTADPGFSPSYLGWVEADGLLRLLTGADVPREPWLPVRTFNADSLSGVKLSTSMNVDTLFGSMSFKQMFYDNWTGTPS